jgi:signal transduction histidine kinase/CheY-like chemotaxis protein
VIFGDSGPEAASLIRDGIARARAEIGRQGQGCSFPVTTSTGEPRDVAAWIAPVEVDGTPSELIWLHDVTDLRQAEREARAATAAKSTFLATMSHEIRTPMNGVITIAELLSETPLDREQAAMVNIIRQSAEGLIRVINDILDFSKLEANEVQIEWLPFRLAETVDGVCQLLRAKAAEKGLALQLVLPEEDPLPRLGDALRLRQVLLNLLGNAIKFTAQGGVTLSVVADGPDVSFTVSDTGIGIPPERLDALFQPYRQAGPGTARTHGGTGLGLSISNALVQLMGGAPIAVVSQPGQGSRFGFHLELPPVPAAEAAPAAESPSGLPGRWCKPDRAVAERHGAVVLCAEDNAINRDVLARVLDRLGFCHDVTEDGQQALACLDRSRHGLLLTDGHMPNLDGWGLTREIRGAERPPGVARLPVVMLTANAVWEMQEIARDCDIDSCLTKPLRLDQLESTLLALLPVLGRLRTRADAAADSAADLPANDVPALEMSARERQAVELPALDLAALVGLVGDSPDDLAAVLADFQRSAAELGVQIRRAETAGDSVALARHAHSLKGAASTAGAARLADCAAALEQAAKQAARAAVLADAGGAVYGELAKLPGDIDRALAHHRAVTP